MTLRIRDERPDDHSAIHALTAAAFAPMRFSDGTEPAIIVALRAAGDLTLSLVAEDDGVLVGHVAFSPVTIAGRHDGWFGLGPISVRPGWQRKGIGKALVRTGLERLGKMGATGCALIGDPAYYGQFGFRNDGRLVYSGLEDRFVQWLVLAGAAPKGALQFAAGFDAGQAAPL